MAGPIKYWFTHLDRQDRRDWVCQAIADHAPKVDPGWVLDQHHPDVLLLGVSYFNDYQFDRIESSRLARCGVKTIVLDYLEYGWNVTQDHRLGTGVGDYYGTPRAAYMELDAWLAEHRPAAYFKRELPINSVHTDIEPIDFINFLDHGDLEATEREYAARPLDMWFAGWHTSPSRTHFYGWCLEQNAKAHLGWCGMPVGESVFKHHVCLHWGELDQHSGPKMFLMPVWHSERKPFGEMIACQATSKIALSFNGCGRKCFRDFESIITSLLARQENGLQWAFPWRDGQNAIILPNYSGSTLIDPQASYLKLLSWLDRPKDLFDLYRESRFNGNKYAWRSYINHLLTRIYDKL